MGGGNNNLNDILENGEKFTKVFVTPMVEAVQKEMKTHVDEVKKALEVVQSFEGRIGKLESNQKKALVGWGAFAAALSTAGIGLWGWIKGHVHFG